MATERPQADEITMTDLSKAQPTPIRVETSIGALSLFRDASKTSELFQSFQSIRSNQQNMDLGHD
jgi:hypothetical protein